MTVKTYRPNPQARVRAVQWTGENWSEIPAEWKTRRAVELTQDGRLVCYTLAGPSPVTPGSYVAEGEVGEVYPVRELIFERRWEPVT